MDKTDREIKNLGINWFQNIENIGFQGGCLGEITLTEEETIYLADKLASQKDGYSFFSAEQSSVLAVVAVNLAYYLYGDEGGSFLAPLFGGAYTQEFVSIVGEKVEDLLLEKKLIAKRRQGPWRYVGLIVRQAIVTRKYLPRLAQFLNSMDNYLGLDKLDQITFDTYAAIIHFMSTNNSFSPNWEEGTGIFFETLRKPYGFHLVKSVGIIYQKLRTKNITVEEVIGSPGFRTSFWQELLPLLQGNDKTKKGSLFRQPIFKYDYTLNRVGIQFDKLGVQKQLYQILLDDKPKTVTSIFVSIDSENLLTDKFSVNFLEKGNRIECFVQGWNPHRNSHTIFQALFRSYDGRLVATAAEQPSLLAEGIYYLITSDDIEDSSIDDLDLEYYNSLEIEGENLYNVWTVNLDEHKVIPGLARAGFKQPHGLEWINPSYFPGTRRDEGIFLNKPPHIKISDWDRLHHRYRLVRFEDGRSRIVTEDKLNIINQNEVTFGLDCDHLKKGSVRLEPFGHSTVYPACSELNYFLLPSSCRVNWSKNLLESGEKPNVSLQGMHDYEVEWPESSSSGESDSEQWWEFDSGKSYAYGYSGKYANLDFAIRFFQAEFYSINPISPNKRNFVWTSCFDSESEFIVSGHYSLPIELGLRHSNGIQPIWKDHEDGRIRRRLKGISIKDALPGKEVASGEFVVRYKNEWKNTGCLYASEEGLIKKLCLDTFDNSILFLGDITEQMLQAQAALHKGSKYTFTDNESLPTRLKTFFEFVEAGTLVFDESIIIDLNDCKYAGIDYREWVEWYNQSLRDSNYYELMRSKPRTLPDLPVERWNQKIISLLSIIGPAGDIDGLINEWKMATCKFLPEEDLPTESLGTIGQLKGIEMLLRATHYYKIRKFGDAQRVTQRKVVGSAKPIKVLATILHSMAQIRQGSLIKVIDRATHSDPWDKILDEFWTIVEIFYGTVDEGFGKKKSVFNQFCQILEVLKETELVKTLQSIAKQDWSYLDSLTAENDWLLHYIVFKNETIRREAGIDDLVNKNILNKQIEEGRLPKSQIAFEIIDNT